MVDARSCCALARHHGPWNLKTCTNSRAAEGPPLRGSATKDRGKFKDFHYGLVARPPRIVKSLQTSTMVVRGEATCVAVGLSPLRSPALTPTWRWGRWFRGLSARQLTFDRGRAALGRMPALTAQPAARAHVHALAILSKGPR